MCNNNLFLIYHMIHVIECYIYFLKDVTGKNVLLLPMGSGDDGAHSQNEKIEVRNYIEGVSVIINVV